jgi:hypothetical protein
MRTGSRPENSKSEQGLVPHPENRKRQASGGSDPGLANFDLPGLLSRRVFRILTSFLG